MMTKMFRSVLMAGAVGLFTLSATPVLAQSSVQTVMVSEGQQIKAELSMLYPTRMFFEYDAGAQLIFNQAEGETPEIGTTVDEKGDVYLSVVAGMSGEKISGFLVTEADRTYPIEFTIRNRDAAQVKIVSLEAKAKAEQAERERQAVTRTADLRVVEWSKKSSYHDSIAHLMRGLYHGAMPEGFVVDGSPSRKVERYEGFDRQLTRRFVAQNVEALTYSLKNANEFSFNPEMHVDWFKPYVAIAFATDNLQPGQSSSVYVLRPVEADTSVGGSRYGR